jgi:hypothetical protein
MRAAGGVLVFPGGPGPGALEENRGSQGAACAPRGGRDLKEAALPLRGKGDVM